MKAQFLLVVSKTGQNWADGNRQLPAFLLSALLFNIKKGEAKKCPVSPFLMEAEKTADN